MSKTVQFTEREIAARLAAERATPEYKNRMKRLKAIRDEDIDFSDIPEVEFGKDSWRPGRGGKRPGAGRKPGGNVALYIRVPKPWAAGYRAEARKTNRTLSEVVFAHLRQPAKSH
ncbi:MAG: hypothetical protein LBR12_06540 [Opitutaceae bacterium]|jgi:hypothetical protein|nr:hypothetical protein [Opitutaceae bacterium]